MDTYEKKYNDAMARLELVVRTGMKLDPAYIFPELAESEDERIRKGLIQHLKELRNWKGGTMSPIKVSSHYDAWIAYLEKQKEEEGYEAIPVESTLEYKLGFKAGKESEKQKEQKPVEPSGKLSRQDYLYQLLIDQLITYSDYEYLTGKKPVEWSEDKDFDDCLTELVCELYEQRDESPENTAFRECEVLKKWTPILLKKAQQKQEWSDTDNIGWDEAFACVTRAEKAAKNEEELQNAVTAEKWLKEIKFKYYVHPVKQEWSKEDEKMRNLIIETLDDDSHYFPFKETKKKMMDWLKSLRPFLEPSKVCYGAKGDPDPAGVWKPSEEQMEALLNAEKYLNAGLQYGSAKRIAELFEQLKKL